MEGPSFLPPELLHYTSSNNDGELLNALLKKPIDLVSFFEIACEDESWCEGHFKFIRLAMRWASKSYYSYQLPLPLAKKIVASIQKRFNFFKQYLYFRPALFYTVTFFVENEPIFVNCLMFGIGSSYFYDLIRSGCFNKLSYEATLNRFPLPLFRLVEEYLLKGEIDYLWKCEQTEIHDLMKLANSISIFSLVKECADVLRRYISKDNVVETLLKAHNRSFYAWKKHAEKIFNDQGWGLRVLEEKQSNLKIEFLNYKQETLELFDVLAPAVTHLAFSGHLSEDVFYKEAIRKCPKLVGIDLCNSLKYADQFSDIPQHISEIDLSACAWLNAQYLQEISLYFPGLYSLNMGSNLHLNYLTWGELFRFKKLSVLHLPRLNQISDEDLKLISHACPNLVELNLEECRNFSDAGLLEVISHCRFLSILNLNRCAQLTDKILFALGSFGSLSSLSIVRCTLLSEKNLVRFVEKSSNLRFLNVQQCDFSPHVLEELRRLFPLLTITYT